MADNYLEKRMDDYRNGRIGQSNSSHRTNGSLKYPHLTVMVANASGDIGRSVIRSFTEAGGLVIFTCQNRNEGQNIAQSCGGRYYPLSLEQIAADLCKRGERINAIIGLECNPSEVADKLDLSYIPRMIQITNKITAESSSTVNMLIGDDPKQISILSMTLSHPAITICGQVIQI